MYIFIYSVFVLFSVTVSATFGDFVGSSRSSMACHPMLFHLSRWQLSSRANALVMYALSCVVGTASPMVMFSLHWMQTICVLIVLHVLVSAT